MDINYAIKEARYYKKLNGLPRAAKKFLLTQTPLKNAVNTNFYNKIYAEQIKKKTKKINPKILQIENTNLCNAKCIMCPHGIMKRKGSVMSLENFKKIVDNVLNSYSINGLTITGFGEPLVDPGIFEKIKYVNEKYPKLKIDLYTNAFLLTKETTEKLIDLKINRITFSINGTKKSYKRIMGLDYDVTEKNVNYFLKRKKEKRIQF